MTAPIAPAGDVSRWSWHGAARALAVGASTFALGAAIGFGIVRAQEPHHGPGDETRATEPAGAGDARAPRRTRHLPPPAGDAELALLAPLRRGSELRGWSVERIDAVRAGILRVHLVRGDARVRLEIALAGAAAPSPPATSGRYAVYYAARGDAATQAPALAIALARVLDRNADVEVPPGLEPYRDARRR